MQVTQIDIKTRNQIFNDFITLAKEALSVFGVSNWEVRQLRQIFKVNVLKPSVFISVISTKQWGQQYTKKQKTNGTINKTKNTKQEVKIRFSATRRELETDTLATYSGTDILKLIKEYTESEEGIQFLAKLGYAQYKAEDVSEQDFMNDDDNFQFLPYFDCVFLHTNSWTSTIPEISKFHGNTYPV